MKRKIRNLVLSIGDVTIVFLLLTMLMLPLFDPRNIIFSSASSSGPEPYLYQNFTPPSNSFGCGPQVYKFINWSFFWDFFENNSNWLLEFTSKLGDPWTDYSSYLDFVRIRNDSFEKQIINFTAPDTGYYRLNYTVDGNITDFYFNETFYTLHFNVSIPDTNETYYVFYNWSDIIHSSWGSYITWNYGVNTQGMYLSVDISSKINKNSFISIDPIFGDDYERGAELPVLDNGKTTVSQMYGRVITIPSSYNADSVWAYITSDSSSAVTCNVSIWSSDGSTLIAEATSEEISAGTAWIEFDLPTSPMLNGDYYFMLWGDLADVANTKSVDLMGETSGSNTTGYQAQAGFPTLPVSLSLTEDTSSEASIL